jgi:hypothetical protein
MPHSLAFFNVFFLSKTSRRRPREAKSALRATKIRWLTSRKVFFSQAAEEKEEKKNFGLKTR